MEPNTDDSNTKSEQLMGQSPADQIPESAPTTESVSTSVATNSTPIPEMPPIEQPAIEQSATEQQSPITESGDTAPIEAADKAPTDTAEIMNNVDSTPTANEEKPAKKSNKTLTIVLASILALGIIAIIVWLLCFPPNGNNNSGSGSGPNDGSGNSSSGQSSSNNVAYDLGEFSDFDLKFLQLENDETNKIYSPLSIKYALAMLSDATDGDSYAQIYNLIGDYTPKTYTNNEHRSFANAMFINNNAKDEILSTYTDTISSKYGASVIFDPFTSVTPFNTWISDKTMGIINNMLDDSILRDEGYETTFLLVNALAIDMNWNYKLQCNMESNPEVKCIVYSVKFPHENYNTWIGEKSIEFFEKIKLNGKEIVSAEIGSTANRYDIISELGEDYIRSTVLTAYNDWLEDNKERIEQYPNSYDADFDIEKYIEELSANYNAQKVSTDFYFNDADKEKVFAKDLQEYDGSTLQYISIMPKDGDLSTYINSINAERIGSLISGLKDASRIDNYKDGVVTKLSAYIPLFNFDYELALKDDLQKLGVSSIFVQHEADLSKLTSDPGYFIHDTAHKANIDFSNEGIRAAAATMVAGGRGSGGKEHFDYKWDVPVEEIDLTFDKPFLFLIRDKETGEIWFTGTFYNA